MNRQEIINRLIASHQRMRENLDTPLPDNKAEEEGGCGVVGFCCTEPVAARHIHEPSRQMHNRGNGKGGGIAALGFIPEQLGVTREVLDNYYMVHIAFLDNGVRDNLESKYILPYFDVKTSKQLDTVEDWTAVSSLEARPPDVRRYFLKTKPAVLDSFITKNNLEQMSREDAEAEFLTQQSFQLNQEYYASLGDKQAFVMSYGKDIMILKVVGYAETITEYYRIDDLKAHVWIAHQRFPTKGRVWHPGGAHPFGAFNTALVHNGDFANYHSVCEYLAQRHIYPQFLTDTEVSVQLFDLMDRLYGYPLEYIIEALAPTMELDFDRLPKDKQSIYRAIQAAHIHSSPDGPWFFIIARSLPQQKSLQLMGITDTAMLRPQVFAFCDGEVQVGLICSEKQAIDATLLSMSKEDNRICPIADRYWNARGGSHTDGGSFIFDLKPDASGHFRMTCTDKFGKPVSMPKTVVALSGADSKQKSISIENAVRDNFEKGAGYIFDYISKGLATWSISEFKTACDTVVGLAANSGMTADAISVMTLLNDRRYPLGGNPRKYVLTAIRDSLHRLFDSLPKVSEEIEGQYRLIDIKTIKDLRSPKNGEKALVINAMGFDAEGEACDSALVMDAYFKGWRHFISYNLCGQRFAGCGLGPDTDGVTVDVYDSSGDYLGSGIDGLTITVHGNAQDQVGQIIKQGKLVIHGDVGQTFLYGAKGGETYVLGNAAGRPLINSVGRPRVVINGTCLDFLAESFMAGDVFNGGGFVIVNAITFDVDGNMVGLKEPYPGGNLFSLASGGALYVRDPRRYIVRQQLNGGEFFRLTDEDWEIILPYLQQNEKLFGISINDLLTVDGVQRLPSQVYRKVAPSALAKTGAKVENSDEL
jgi:glutamate synthase domain-containing protein 1/glutamate synthase domain-containing protein 3